MSKLASAILALVAIGGCGDHRAHVATPEASAPLAKIAIHYAPTPALTETWRQLFALLPAHVEVEVEVTAASEFAHFMAELRASDVPNRGRFRVVVSRRAQRACTVASRSTQLDEHTYAVGDPRSAVAFLGTTPTDEAEAKRYDRTAEVLAAKGFRVVRFPVVVRGATLISYTDALFDRERDGTRVVYLPTYALPALDLAAQKLYEREGFVVRPIDAAPGGVGCLVDVLARG